jgi:hypothetical protein
MPAMRYGISFTHPACFTVDNSFTKAPAPAMAGSKQCSLTRLLFSLISSRFTITSPETLAWNRPIYGLYENRSAIHKKSLPGHKVGGL